MSTTQEVLQQDLKKLLNSGNNPNMPTTLLAHQKMTNYTIQALQGGIQLANCSLNDRFKFTRKACQKIQSDYWLFSG